MSLWKLEVGTHRNAMCPRFAALTADRRRKEQARATVGNEEKKELARMGLDQDHRDDALPLQVRRADPPRETVELDLQLARI